MNDEYSKIWALVIVLPKRDNSVHHNPESETGHRN